MSRGSRLDIGAAVVEDVSLSNGQPISIWKIQKGKLRLWHTTMTILAIVKCR